MLKVDITKSLPGFKLDVKFTVSPGITALFGPSGSGKSLTLKYISGILTPDQGEISLHDRILFHRQKGINLPPQKRKVGFLFQNYALFPHLTVKENIIYGINHLSKEKQMEKLIGLLQTMRLEGLEDKKPGEISGGQQQRVALARTLATDPEMILLDEPFSALDSAVKSRLRAELLDLLNKSQIPALLVTHDLNEAYSLSQNLTIIESGKILQSDDKNSVLHTPVNTTVARLIRTKNIFSGVVENVFDNQITVKTSAGLLQVQAPKELIEKFSVDQNIELFIRPHHIQLFNQGEKKLPLVNIFPGIITNMINHIDGHTVFLKKATGLSLGKEIIYVKIDDTSFHKIQPVLNQSIFCHFPPEYIGIINKK
ncbi:MAG: sulfate/molybdate ABC transporter ATP-binding protein [Bacillota bacterium]|jgi:molybdate transport system ATP-binding protein